MSNIVLICHHPDCVRYQYLGLTALGHEVHVASEEATMKLGFPFSSVRDGKFHLVSELFEVEDLYPEMHGIRFTDTTDGYDLLISIRPEILNHKNVWFDCQMQHDLQQCSRMFHQIQTNHMRRGSEFVMTCNHPQPPNGFTWVPNYVPPQPDIVERKYITQLISETHLAGHTDKLLELRNAGLPVKIHGAKAPDGFILDTEVLKHTALLVHEKRFGINCYAVIKALDMGIPVYISREARQILGFTDLPDECFFFSDDWSIEDAYEHAKTMTGTRIREIYRSIYTLERTTKAMEQILKRFE